ncbi:MAG: ribonuclease HII, partial [Candidatus Binatia bacterium]
MSQRSGKAKGCEPFEMQRFERLLWDVGYHGVAGVDEVGLGPLAGPVVAAAVAFPPGGEAVAVADSKKLSPARRASLDVEIRERALALGLGLVEVEAVDRMGVYAAGLEAMRRAVRALDPAPDYLLVDARKVPGVEVGQTAFNGADGFISCVAAASIVAKVYRDRLMVEIDKLYPGYGFASHKGYGTADHLRALRELGPCLLHRRSFLPVRRLLGGEPPAPSGTRDDATGR